MTKKQVLRFNRLFNDLVQKKVNGRNAYQVSVQAIDHLGGYEIRLKSHCLIWLGEMRALQTICDDLCASCYIKLDESQIIIH